MSALFIILKVLCTQKEITQNIDERQNVFKSKSRKTYCVHEKEKTQFTSGLTYTINPICEQYLSFTIRNVAKWQMRRARIDNIKWITGENLDFPIDAVGICDPIIKTRIN